MVWVPGCRGPAAVLPPPHYQPDSQLQAASGDGVECSSEGLGGLSTEASNSSGGAASGRVCSMCGARHQLHLVVWPSSRHVGVACPCATAHMNVRRSTGGRAATRRRGPEERGRVEGREAERLVGG